MFKESTISLLSQAGINIHEYWNDIFKRLGDDVRYIDLLCLEFKSISMEENNNWFNGFCEKHKIISQGTLYNHLCDMSYALLEFNNNGRLGYFKARQADSYVPPIRLNENDIDEANNTGLLDDEFIIYRGMSNDEFINKKFTQHWTIDFNVARRIAFDTYDEFTNPRVLVEAKIKKQDVIYFYPENEDEIIPRHPVFRYIINPKIIEKS